MAGSVCHAPPIFQCHYKLISFNRNFTFSQANKFSQIILFRFLLSQYFLGTSKLEVTQGCSPHKNAIEEYLG